MNWWSYAIKCHHLRERRSPLMFHNWPSEMPDAQFSFSMNNIMDCVTEMFFGLNVKVRRKANIHIDNAVDVGLCIGSVVNGQYRNIIIIFENTQSGTIFFWHIIMVECAQGARAMRCSHKTQEHTINNHNNNAGCRKRRKACSVAGAIVQVVRSLLQTY